MTNVNNVVIGFGGLAPYTTAALALAAAKAAYNTAVAALEVETGVRTVTINDVATVLYANTAATGFNCVIYGLCQYVTVP